METSNNRNWRKRRKKVGEGCKALIPAWRIISLREGNGLAASRVRRINDVYWVIGEPSCVPRLTKTGLCLGRGDGPAAWQDAASALIILVCMRLCHSPIRRPSPLIVEYRVKPKKRPLRRANTPEYGGTSSTLTRQVRGRPFAAYPPLTALTSAAGLPILSSRDHPTLQFAPKFIRIT